MGSAPESLPNDTVVSDGDRCMTDEERRRYHSAALKSEGFDVPYFPGTWAFCRICPILNPYYVEYARKYAHVAIDHYNATKGESYEMVKLKKANFQACLGILYYITFYAKRTDARSDSPLMTFQAMVLHGRPDVGVVVRLCRPEPEEHKDLNSLDGVLTEGLY